MFYFVLVLIAVTNLALGYAVATQFGFGPKPLAGSEAARALPTFSIQAGEGDETPIDELPPAEPLPETTPVDEPPASEVAAEAAATATASDANDDEVDAPIASEEMKRPEATSEDDVTAVVESSDTNDDGFDGLISPDEMERLAAEMAGMAEAATDSREEVLDASEEIEGSQASIADQLDEAPAKQTAALIEDCQESLVGYRERIIEIDERIRAHEGEENVPVAECLDDMHAANRQYLAEQEEHLSDLVARGDGQIELPPAQQAAVDAVEAQCAKVRKSDESLDSIDGDQPEAVGAVCIETRQLAAASDMMRERLNAALRLLSREHSAPSDDSSTPETDALTGLFARSEFDAAVSKVWPDDADSAQPQSVVLVDMDRFESFNVAHGPHAGDRALRAVADIIKNEAGSQDVAARFSGQQMALLCGDTDGRGATQMAERIRQTVAAAVMLVGDHEEKLTVSCAAAEFAAEASPETLLEHALAALAEAKRYGHNRTFISEGKHATPVVPPSLEVKESRIVLRALAGNAEVEPDENEPD